MSNVQAHCGAGCRWQERLLTALESLTLRHSLLNPDYNQHKSKWLSGPKQPCLKVWLVLRSFWLRVAATITATRGPRPAVQFCFGSYGLPATNFFHGSRSTFYADFPWSQFLKNYFYTLMIHICSSKYQEEYKRLPGISKPRDKPAMNILAHFLLVFFPMNVHLKIHTFLDCIVFIVYLTAFLT